ncbi:ferredoxin/sterol 14-demethylase [Nocardioides sp. YR527]|uniref:ferredoxin n=1 Tax=Nocardioides sp. YR527 TaxID=1881028 RepID=UPI000888F3FC|nr:ferredoxin [Nocardioides sp. YR527]SDJ80893.1 ferredoxin/sterol 14-demethylase [Nocardioides sp. YR527]
MKLTADLGLCQGHQECLAEAPELFGFDDDSYQVVVRITEPSEEQLPAARAAVKYCPAFALDLED